MKRSILFVIFAVTLGSAQAPKPAIYSKWSDIPQWSRSKEVRSVHAAQADCRKRNWIGASKPVWDAYESAYEIIKCEAWRPKVMDNHKGNTIGTFNDPAVTVIPVGRPGATENTFVNFGATENLSFESSGSGLVMDGRAATFTDVTFEFSDEMAQFLAHRFAEGMTFEQAQKAWMKH